MSNAQRYPFLKVMMVWMSLAACEGGTEVDQEPVRVIADINQLKRIQEIRKEPFPEPISATPRPQWRLEYRLDLFPDPIPATEGSIEVNIVEFASLPDFNGEPALMMLLVDEPGTGRLFVNDLFGILYSVSYDGRTVVPYLDLNASQWGIKVLRKNLSRRDRRPLRGFNSFAFHPQFAEAGTPGFGKFYTLVETRNTEPNERRHHVLLLEWTTGDPSAAFYDGPPPRELIRPRYPCKEHCSGMVSFNPSASPGDTDFGLLYMSIGDGLTPDGSQDLSNIYGKILRIDPLGSNSPSGQYGIPADNPFVSTRGVLGEIYAYGMRLVSTRGVLGEIYAYGMRHPQRFGWDVRNGDLFVADIGEYHVEEINLVPAGANLGWRDWEGSFEWVDTWRDDWRLVVRLAVNAVQAIREGHFRIRRPDDVRVFSLDNPRSDARITYPVVEFDRWDPLLQKKVAITGVVVYRHDAIPQLENAVLFGELVSGEVFYFPADDLPEGGQEAIRRVRFKHRGETKTLLQMIQEKNIAQGREPAKRADMRFGTGPEGQVFLLNKRDGTIRRILP